MKKIWRKNDYDPNKVKKKSIKWKYWVDIGHLKMYICKLSSKIQFEPRLKRNKKPTSLLADWQTHSLIYKQTNQEMKKKKNNHSCLTARLLPKLFMILFINELCELPLSTCSCFMYERKKGLWENTITSLTSLTVHPWWTQSQIIFPM